MTNLNDVLVDKFNQFYTRFDERDAPIDEVISPIEEIYSKIVHCLSDIEGVVLTECYEQMKREKNLIL